MEDLEAVLGADRLAVVDAGPGTGRVLALGRSPVLLGRAELDLEDPAWSRHHLRLRLRAGRVEACDAGARHRIRRIRRPSGHPLRRGRGSRESWAEPTALGRSRASRPRPARRLGTDWRSVPVGAALRSGATTLRVTGPARRLVPPQPVVLPTGGRSLWRTLARVAPALLAPLVMLPLLLGSSAGPWRLAILAVPVLGIGLWLLSDRDPAARGPARPAAAEILLLAGSGALPAGPPGDVLRLRLRAGPQGPRRRARRETRLRPGAGVALTGPGAQRQARWLLAQILTHEPTATAAVPAGWPLPAGRGPVEEEAPAGGARRWHVTVRHAGQGDRMPAAPDGRDHVVLAVCAGRPPAWCTQVRHTRACDGVGETWARRHAAALGRAGADEADLPTSVLLTDLVGPPAPGALARRWAAGHGLRVPLGLGPDGPVEVDLVGDGPHALVAGATGTGKSEALTGWLVALAATAPPEELVMVLVDYKGGSAFTPLEPLPHVAAVLTDLAPATTSRALASLGAELRRRERVLAAAGAKDLVDLGSRGAGMPRLLVVVDEFRALADDRPELLADLVRLAAQGRSLGLHLILATQRPSGIVGPDVKANVTIRLSLRVLEPGDSRDVVGTPAAAELPAVPGRAVLRTDRTTQLQVAWLGPTDGGLLRRTVAAIRAAAEDGSTRGGWDNGGGGSGAAGGGGDVGGRDVGGRDVGRRAAVRALPWAPELPRLLRHGEAVPGDPERVLGEGAVALLDEPDLQRLTPWHWDGEALLVLGGPGTGRSTALRTLAAAALSRGSWVHLVGGPEIRPRPTPIPGTARAGEPGVGRVGDAPRAGSTARVGGTGGVGTVAAADDPRLVVRLLTLLQEHGSAPGQVLLVDDAELLLDRLDLVLGTGQSLAWLPGTLRGILARGHHLAIAGSPGSASARWAELGRSRLVLSPRDATEATLAGADRAVAAGVTGPGRAVLVEPGRQRVAQVIHALPDADGAQADRTRTAGSSDVAPVGGTALVRGIAPEGAGPGARAGAGRGPRVPAPAGVPCLVPLPAVAPALAPRPDEGDGTSLVIGVGGDDAGPVEVELGPSGTLLVVGPPGSGRTTVLEALAGRLAASRATIRHGVVADAGPGDVVLLDDLDRLGLAELELGAAIPGTGARVLAATGTTAALTAHRPPLSTWTGGTMIVLRPDLPAAQRLVPGGLGPGADPLAVSLPGRAALVRSGRVTPVQLHAPAAGQRDVRRSGEV